MKELFFDIAVDAPLEGALTYKSKDLSLKAGVSVRVPLGKRKVDAVVLGSEETYKGEFELKEIESQIEDRPLLPETTIKWLNWVSQYYLHPLGQVYQLAFPPLAPAKKKRASKKSPVIPEVEPDFAKPLTEEQQQCFEAINKQKEFGVHLLHGVTGSGKTEVYLQLLAETLKAGKSGLILVPEISLTPQLVKRFSARFPDEVAVIHSHLTDREKTEQWYSIVNKEKRVLIGARSALFCPVDDFGIVIVDEEHDSSFKQEEKLKYNARDAAIVRAKLLNCPIILGSATPCLETWHNAVEGKFQLHQMTKRVSNRPMPDIEVINIKKKSSEDSDLPFWMSPQLLDELKANYESEKQAALFLNRRGTAQAVQCKDCGFTYECPNCSISLTLHGSSSLVCHYCNYTQRHKDHCPECDSKEIEPFGLGTEQVEMDIQRIFPDAKTARADRDEINSREQLEDLIQKMENKEIDFLIGTQMIAKGLDFPHLDLVGFILADVGFNLPDFRASERSYQLLTQVAGRAGRHKDTPGKVILQTYNPQHSSIVLSLKNNFAEFAAHELEERKSLKYPPFGKLVSIRISSNTLDKVEMVANRLQKRCEALKEHRDQYNEVVALGPAPAPLSKVRNRYRYHLLLKGQNYQYLHSFAKELITDQSNKLPSGTKVQIDVDPYNMM